MQLVNIPYNCPTTDTLGVQLTWESDINILTMDLIFCAFFGHLMLKWPAARPTSYTSKGANDSGFLSGVYFISAYLCTV